MIRTLPTYPLASPMLPERITRLLDIGWHLMPVSRTTKKYTFKGALDAASNDPVVISEWLRRWPDCNWRVHMGDSRLLALDIDRKSDLHAADGFKSMFHLVERYGALPDGPRMKSGGSGGCVAFFSCDIPADDLHGSGKLGAGVDILRGRVCPTIPPSIHQVSGGLYRWYQGHAPWEIECPPIPEWILRRLRKPPPPKFDPAIITDDRAGNMLRDAAERVAHAPSGASNRTLNQQAFRMGRLIGTGKIQQGEVLASLLHAAMARKIPRHEADGVIKAGMRAGMRKAV